LITNARKYSCQSSKREWEKTGGKSVFSFLDITPTLTALLASHNFCFRASQGFVSNIEAQRLLSDGRSQPTRLQFARLALMRDFLLNFGCKETSNGKNKKVNLGKLRNIMGEISLFWVKIVCFG
jgi:hypothetical protein